MAKKTVFQSFKGAVMKMIDRKAEERAVEGANILRDHLLKSLTNTPARTGRVYKIPGTNKTYTASAPGEYPAMATGELLARVARSQVKVVRGDERISAEIGAAIPTHGLVLEAGLRPWFSKAADEKRKEIEKALRRKWF